MSEAYDEALRTLRDGVAQPSDGGEATRLRVLAALTAWRARRRRAMVVLASAACLAVSGALAYYVAVRHDAELRHAGGRAALAVQPAAKHLAQRGSALRTPGDAYQLPASAAQADLAHQQGGDAGAPSPSAASADPLRAVRAAPSSGPTGRDRRAPRGADAHAPSPAPPAAPARSALGAPELQALYWTAHQLHFQGAPERALAAWDAYLAGAPEGPLVIEARYNRAIVLLRLGRHAEARAVLEAFARGDYGAFRRADARLLLRP